jgi:subtilisin family serine protease
VNLIPSYPNAKTPELKLFYDVKILGNKENAIVALGSENVFQDINDYGVDFPISEECISTNDSVFTDGTDYAIDLIQANCAWTITKGNENIVLGIADTEFDENHEDLANQFLSVSGPTSPYSTEHGTLVSGIAGAEPNNGKGIKGVGYNTKMKGYRVLFILFGSWTKRKRFVRLAKFLLCNIMPVGGQLSAKIKIE